MGVVLSQPHRIQQSDLVVMPYFDFVQPAASPTPQDPGVTSQDATKGDLTFQGHTVPAAEEEQEEEVDLYESEDLDKAEDMEVNEEETEEVLPAHFPIDDPAKLNLFKLSNFQEDTERKFPNVKVQVGPSGVHIVGSDRHTIEAVKRCVSDCLSNMAEAGFSLEQEKAELLSREDVKERLQRVMRESGWPSLYAVSGANVTVTSMTQDSAKQARRFLESQPRRFSIQVDPQHTGLSCCREWTQFLRELGLVAVTSWRPEGTLDLLTLDGLEAEKAAAIREFLAAPIERETFLPMELGKLKYLQIHRHQLLAEMDQVSIYPLESDKVCGLKVGFYAEVWKLFSLFSVKGTRA